MSCKYLKSIKGLSKLVLLISCLFSPKRIWEQIDCWCDRVEICSSHCYVEPHATVVTAWFLWLWLVAPRLCLHGPSVPRLQVPSRVHPNTLSRNHSQNKWSFQWFCTRKSVGLASRKNNCNRASGGLEWPVVSCVLRNSWIRVLYEGSLPALKQTNLKRNYESLKQADLGEDESQNNLAFQVSSANT